ncbi:MAG: hypothetical protein KGL39_49080, partial [Patescibacteria group bacterium]|nr:hypothetical protein [Patescibacteria group bacterium]
MNGTKWPQEIEDKMHVRPFEEPRESEGVMTQAELEAFPEARDRQILLHVSRISILLQHILISHCNLIDQCRQHEATSIQER